MRHEDIRRRGFKDRTRLASAREQLAGRVPAHGRTESVDLLSADGRVTAAPIAASRNVPHYDRAAMDGYAVRAEDTFGASSRAPNRLQVRAEIEPGTAVRVHTGSALPAGADGVVMIEQTERDDEVIDVFDAVAVGENVGSAGEDVTAGDELIDAHERLSPSDIGLLKAVGYRSIEVVEQPRVAVIPTGDELVQREPGPGEIIETNGLSVTQLVRRWGGEPDYHEIVPDDGEALERALTEATDLDLVVTTGGSSVGERDLVPEIVEGIGEVFVHGVALKPGHPVALGMLEGTPIIMLPGYPVACLVNAVQFVCPAIAWTMETYPRAHPTVFARLTEKLRSEPGQRTFARVELDEEDGESVAIPVRASGAGVLSSVTRADGWVEIPEAMEGIPAGETVEVQDWEWIP